ncbi:uncharacterized protein ASCRUDRAFT_83169 [Ascoidea rubescens DSM 1968]|uniref:Uncharacterized protein n=1 Tax=Ascoidea rubescens DSM 1968 TaxID=1344418 RepID=A0A1D2V8N6_9ASCO|nr:hypothetical protein ASCRUDRAFT_83169 [Ascoidea rubescens DSM 1968]ODV57877.1 hypothetical protein ASCRUDRAFT_83169 [Ascoidea rubescens DSM 1968]
MRFQYLTALLLVSFSIASEGADVKNFGSKVQSLASSLFKKSPASSSSIIASSIATNTTSSASSASSIIQSATPTAAPLKNTKKDEL